MASTLLLAQSALSLPRLPPISLPTRPPHLHTPLPPHLPRLATPPRAGPIIASADGSRWATFAILTCAAATGRRLGTVPVGRTLSGPICAMGLTFAGACSGVRNRRVCASANDEGTFQVRAARERASARRTRGAST